MNDNIRQLKIYKIISKIINSLDFKPEKLSIKTENDKLITIITHQVRYENVGFYLTIDNVIIDKVILALVIIRFY